MTDDRMDTRGGDGLPPEAQRDARVLRDVTARDLPPLARSLAIAQARRPGTGRTIEERFMNTVATRTGRAWLVTAASAAVLALAVLLVPVSYDRTTGQRVAITIAGAPDDAAVRPLALGMKSALGGGPVTVGAEAAGGSVAYTLETVVPAASRIDAPAAAAAFARQLVARGWHATAKVTPVVEHVTGSAYAYVRDLVIHVQTDGKTPAQIEAEIRDRLAAAGLPDAQVSVTDEGRQRKVTLDVQRTGAKPGELPGNITLELSGKNDPGAKNAFNVKQMLLRSASGETLKLEVSRDGRTTSVEIANPKAMGDAALADAVRAKLAAAGFANLEVTASGGRVTVTAR